MGEIETVGVCGSMNGILAIREMNQSPSADAKQGLQPALDIVGGKDFGGTARHHSTPKNATANADQFECER
jgi:hypothetical protein